MNYASMKGNNLEDADKYNNQFWKRIPKDAKINNITVLEKLWGNNYISYVKDLPHEDIDFIGDTKGKHHMAQTITLEKASHST